MEKNVLDSLWNKMCDVFATQDQVSAALQGKQDIMSAGRGISIQNNVISNTATEEVVSIVVSSQVAGFDPEGLVVSVYYNDSDTVTTTVTLDEQGRGTLVVPHDYKYKLVFPDVTGCDPIPAVVHFSMIVQRSIEIEYVEEHTIPNEQVEVTVTEQSGSSYVAAGGVTVSVTSDGNSEQYTTDSSGKVAFLVPYGTSYTVSVPDRSGYYLMPAAKTRTLYANRTSRYITIRYQDPQSGLYIVAADGTEYAPDAWAAAVEGGTRQNSDAKVIKIATSALVTAGGVFGIDIDMVRERTYSQGLQWCPSNVKFNSIPENGNSASALYYYDGLSASKLIQTEGDDRGLNTPAVDDCLARSMELGGVTHEGFLGSVGQWAQLWANITAIDDILLYTRPDGTSLLGQIVVQKWTSTQISAGDAWFWYTSANNFTKGGSYAVVPFFAF